MDFQLVEDGLGLIQENRVSGKTVQGQKGGVKYVQSKFKITQTVFVFCRLIIFQPQ